MKKKGKLVKGENRTEQNKWVKIVQQRKKTTITASPTVEPWPSSFGKVIIFKAFSREILPIDAVILEASAGSFRYYEFKDTLEKN